MEEKNLSQEEVIQNQIHTAGAPPERNLLANKPLIIGVAALVLLALLGLFLFLQSRDNNKPQQTHTTVTTKPPGKILFEPADTILLPSSKTTTDITINTGGNMVKGVVIALEYNPRILRNVELAPYKDTTSAISYALEQVGIIRHDKDKGKIDMLLKLPEGSQGLSGKGIVARLSYEKANFDVAIQSSLVEMQPNTNLISAEEGTVIPVTKNQLQISFSK